MCFSIYVFTEYSDHISTTQMSYQYLISYRNLGWFFLFVLFVWLGFFLVWFFLLTLKQVHYILLPVASQCKAESPHNMKEVF